MRITRGLMVSAVATLIVCLSLQGCGGQQGGGAPGAPAQPGTAQAPGGQQGPGGNQAQQQPPAGQQQPATQPQSGGQPGMQPGAQPGALPSAQASAQPGAGQATVQGAAAEGQGQAAQGQVGDLLARGTRVEGLSYEFSMTGGGQSVTGKVWMQGKKSKFETTAGPQTFTLIFDPDAGCAYMYSPGQNKAMKLPVTARAKPAHTPIDYASEVDVGQAKVVGSDAYDGKQCRIIEFPSSAGSGAVKMWVREDYGIPVRVEVTDSSGGKFVMEYRNMRVGRLPDDTFSLPAGMEVLDLQKLPSAPTLPSIPGIPGTRQ